MKPSPRVDYDAIAYLYDTQPYREKTVDPELVVFLEQRAAVEAVSILDVGCGTGNQLIANRTLGPHANLVGLDRFLGMLCARPGPKPQTSPGCRPMEGHSPGKPRALISSPVNTLCIISRTRRA